MNPLGMTKRQLELLVFLKTFISEHGYSPNYDEICAGIGMQSKGGAHAHIVRLEDRGFVKRLAGQSRSIALTEDGLAVASVPRGTSAVAA